MLLLLRWLVGVVLVVVLELFFPGALPLASAGVGGYDGYVYIFFIR
jgi:hypothetical protein